MHFKRTMHLTGVAVIGVHCIMIDTLNRIFRDSLLRSLNNYEQVLNKLSGTHCVTYCRALCVLELCYVEQLFFK